MNVKKVLPGQRGTRGLLKKYGSRLVCVRYRYDEKRQLKVKSVELVIDQQPWRRNQKRIPANKTVLIRVAYGEVHIGRLVRNAGGIWNKRRRLWELPYGEARALGLEERIVSEVPDNRNLHGPTPSQKSS